jgi:hypothetical protein
MIAASAIPSGRDTPWSQDLQRDVTLDEYVNSFRRS